MANGSTVRSTAFDARCVGVDATVSASPSCDAGDADLPPGAPDGSIRLASTVNSIQALVLATESDPPLTTTGTASRAPLCAGAVHRTSTADACVAAMGPIVPTRQCVRSESTDAKPRPVTANAGDASQSARPGVTASVTIGARCEKGTARRTPGDSTHTPSIAAPSDTVSSLSTLGASQTTTLDDTIFPTLATCPK